MTRHTLPLLGLLAISLAGCTYSVSMRKGAVAAEEGDWLAAVEHYERAKDAKAKPEALEAWGAARLEAIEENLDHARIAIDTGSWEAARNHIDTVAGLSSDNPDVYSLDRDLREAMQHEVDTHWELGNIRTAYTTAVRLRALFPREDHEALFEQLREHFAQRARDQKAEGRYEDALASVRTITEFEPDRTSHIAPLEHGILNAWADAMKRDAQRHVRARRKGAAALLYARAYEIAGRQPDLAEAQELATELGEDTRFDYRLRITGSGSRAGQIREIVEKATPTLEDTDSSRATLTVSVDASGARCTEDKTSTPATQDYISGQIEVPNPEHATLTDRLAKAEAAAVQANAEAERLWPEVQNAERSLAFFDDLVQMAQKEFDAAQAELTQAQQQMAKIERAQADVEAHIAELQLVGPGVEATLAKRQNELGKIAGLKAEWQGVLLQAQAASGEAERELNGLRIERDPAAAALERISAGYKAVVDDRTRFQQLASETRATLVNTPTTVMEDVHETLAYDIHDWTRTCSAPLSVSASTGWRTDLETRKRFAPELQTTDRSHIGHELAALTEDPKAYPDEDSALIAKADAESAQQVAEWLVSLADDYYETRSLETTMALSKDPERGADAMLGLYLGAPDRVDEATLLTFRTHARQHFGLENLELLGAERNAPMASR